MSSPEIDKTVREFILSILPFLLPILTFLFGFLVNHFYRRWYIERPRLRITLVEARWRYSSVGDKLKEEGFDLRLLILHISFTVRNPGASVSIVQFTVSLPEIEGIEIDKRCWGPKPGKEMPVDPQHQVTLTCEWTFTKDTIPSSAFSISPGHLSLNDSLGNKYSHQFQVEAAPRYE